MAAMIVIRALLRTAISPEVSVVSDDELVKTFKEVVESGSVEETKQFDIDTEKLDFKGKIICKKSKVAMVAS
jgi:hypothetical protein